MKNVYIIEPLEHGNGGCHGFEVLECLPLEEALKTNPVEKYNINHYSHPFGFWPRICQSENMNDCMYAWDYYDQRWELKS